MQDLISRQAAINAVENTDCELSSNAWDEITDAIMQVPSAQPDLAQLLAYECGKASAWPELIRCKDCKHSEHWYRDKRRCFLWAEDGIDVFDDGFCNYAAR